MKIVSAVIGVGLLVLSTGWVRASAPCPSKIQKILVIDLKSGWWQGDGGDTHAMVASEIQSQCKQVSLEYQHRVVYGGGFGAVPNRGGRFPKDPYESYHQIWLLSGGEADGADLRTGSEEFQGYLSGIEKSSANLFLGTGFGNVYHANAVSARLGLGSLVATNRETHEYPYAPSGVEIVDELPTSALDLSSLLFRDVSSLPHVVKVAGFEAVSDWLVSDPRIHALAKQSDEKIVIGEVSLENRKILIDANLARTYAIRNKNANIAAYLLNLVSTLEHD